MSLRMKWLLISACLVALVSWTNAQEEKQEKKSAAGEAASEVPDGTPDELMQYITKQRQSRQANLDNVLTAADKILAHEKATDQQKKMARQTKLGLLFSLSQRDAEKHGKQFEEYADQLIKESPKSDEAATAAGYRAYRKHFNMQVRSFDDKAGPVILDLVKEHPKSQMVGQLTMMYARQLSQEKKEKEATQFVEKAIESLGEGKLADGLKGMLVNMQLMGKPLPIAGPTLEGSEFNIDSLKGKVVLVDFWATWCGPCIQELPHVKEAYQKYHDKGFEIVGISLDNDRKDLEEFVKKEDMSWTQIVFSKKEDMGWSSPLAKKFGVNSIPATFLIGREGKVVARDLRGEALAEAVEKELNKPATKLAN